MSRDIGVHLPDRPDPSRLATVAAATGLALTPSGQLRHDGRYCADLGDPRLGLPARPVAWSWFGPAYRRLVPRTLPTTPAGRGLRTTTWDALRGRG